MISSLFYLPDQAGGVSCDRTVVRYVFCDNASCVYDTAIVDMNTWQNRDFCVKLDVVSDVNRQRLL